MFLIKVRYYFDPSCLLTIYRDLSSLGTKLKTINGIFFIFQSSVNPWWNTYVTEEIDI